MPSLDAPGAIQIADRQNANFRNEGGAIVTTSGLFPQGKTSQKSSTFHETQGFDRSSAEFGTQPSVGKSQYSVVCQAPAKKVTSSDDKSLDGGLISRATTKVAPSATDQPEIANKPVSQQSTYHTGNRLVIRNSDDDSLVARNAATGFTPGP